MQRFKFRLQKVLEYRIMAEDWAKQAVAEAQAQLNEGQMQSARIRQRREELIRSSSPRQLQDFQALNAYLEKLDDDEAAQAAVNQILENELEQTKEQWIKCRQETKAMTTLKDQKYAEWVAKANQEEQNQLDEFAVNQRRAA